MPYRAARPCTHPGCPELVRGRESRCPAHRREEFRRQDQRRGSASARGYGARWQRLRLLALSDEPLCRMHAARGEVVPATEVDHIDGDSRNNDRANLRPLCKSCHSGRTMRDQVPRRRR